MLNIRDAVCDDKDNDLFAVADFDGLVEVWSFRARNLVSRFQTIMDFGGRRLALVTCPKPILVAAAWARYGIAGYDARTGEKLWQRKDLRKAQVLVPGAQETARPVVAAEIAERPCVVLDAQTGETVERLMGVTQAYINREGDIGAQVTKRIDVRLFDLPGWKLRQVWSCGFVHFLDAAFGNGGLLLSMVTGPSQFVSMTRGVEWTYTPLKGAHHLRVAWHEATRTWRALEYPYEKSVPFAFLVLSTGGEVLSKTLVDGIHDGCFFNGGGSYITSKGEVLDLPSRKASWQFQEPALSQ